MTRKIILAAAFIAAVAVVPAHARIVTNGFTINGWRLNGIDLKGVSNRVSTASISTAR